MVGFLVLGVLIWVGSGVIDAVTIGSGVSALTARTEVSTDVTPVRNGLDNYSASVKACNGKLDCVTQLDR